MAGLRGRQTGHRSRRAGTRRNSASVGTPDPGQRPGAETPDNHGFHTHSFGVAARCLTTPSPTYRRSRERRLKEIAQRASITGQREKIGVRFAGAMLGLRSN
jgi:hypothetical protein